MRFLNSSRESSHGAKDGFGGYRHPRGGFRGRIYRNPRLIIHHSSFSLPHPQNPPDFPISKASSVREGTSYTDAARTPPTTEPLPPPLQPPLNNAVLRNLLNSATSVLDPGIRSRTAGTNSLVNVVLEWVTLQSVSHSVFPHLDLTSKNPELDQSLLHRDTQLNLNLSFEFLPVLPRPLSVCPCLSLKPS